jgi:transcriptional regulator with XRE-family HTH domain
VIVRLSVHRREPVQEEYPEMGSARRPQPEHLPAKLLGIRQLLGLTQAQMAARLGHLKSPPQPGLISRFEQGKREPSLLVLLEYARIAGVSMETLVDDELDLPNRLLSSGKGRKTKSPRLPPQS